MGCGCHVWNLKFDLHLVFQKQPPRKVLDSFKVPNLQDINFHNIRSYNNRSERETIDTYNMAAFPIPFLLDDIKTNFVTVSEQAHASAVLVYWL